MSNKKLYLQKLNRNTPIPFDLTEKEINFILKWFKYYQIYSGIKFLPHHKYNLLAKRLKKELNNWIEYYKANIKGDKNTKNQ